MARDEFSHFLQAQDPVYNHVLQELSTGQKQSHCMWFIFPQLRGLGRSEMAERFAIQTLEEAARYAADPVLGQRLRQCTQLVIQIQDRTISEIFGFPDDLKFHSSMTLFALAVPGELLFQATLKKYFDGKLDGKTDRLLKAK